MGISISSPINQEFEISAICYNKIAVRSNSYRPNILGSGLGILVDIKRFGLIMESWIILLFPKPIYVG